METEIRYVVGDALSPVRQSSYDVPIVIAHVCNDLGAWGAGFVLAVSRRWRKPELMFKGRAFLLGDVQFVDVEKSMFVANMIAQRGFPTRDRRVALDYAALTTCLEKVAGFCLDRSAEVHAPRFGCGIAGGTWDRVEAIIKHTLTRSGVPVTIYDLQQEQK
jgi:hypothetical protein